MQLFSIIISQPKWSSNLIVKNSNVKSLQFIYFLFVANSSWLLISFWSRTFSFHQCCILPIALAAWNFWECWDPWNIQQFVWRCAFLTHLQAVDTISNLTTTVGVNGFGLVWTAICQNGSISCTYNLKRLGGGYRAEEIKVRKFKFQTNWKLFWLLLSHILFFDWIQVCSKHRDQTWMDYLFFFRKKKKQQNITTTTMPHNLSFVFLQYKSNR